MPTSSIDDVLAQSMAGRQPIAPETQPSEIEVSEIQQQQEAQEDILQQSATPEVLAEDESEADAKPEMTEDEYGNPEPASQTKTYTEQEVNERINQAIRERLARLDRNSVQQQPSQAQIQQAAQQGFEYDDKSSESWQQQLENFVEQTVTRMSQKQAQQAFQEKEQRAQAEFEAKFHTGMSKFTDFHQVVGTKPITDAMVIATRAMSDPAAFLYAASKRAPQDLERISKIPDQYAQMVEMGKLEEKLKKSKEATRAPKPAAKVSEDMGIPHKSDKEPTIEDLIARSNARRMAVRNRHKR